MLAEKDERATEVTSLEREPDMPSVHRPDYDVFRSTASRGITYSRLEDKTAFMWPNINIEDLVAGKALLLFVIREVVTIRLCSLMRISRLLGLVKSAMPLASLF